MASIPLPALHVASQPDPTENLGRMLALRSQLQNAPIQRQILQQQADSGAIENQKAQQDQADRQALTKAMSDWDGKDWQQLPSLVLKNGGSGVAAIGAKQKLLEQQQTFSKIAADDATTGEKKLETLKGQHDMLSGMLTNVLNAPDDKLSATLGQTAQDAISQGLLDPQHAQAVQQMAQLPPDQLRAQLKATQNGLLTSTQQMEQALKSAQTTEAISKGKEADAQAGKANAEVQGSTGQFAEARYRRVLSDLAAHKQVSDADIDFAKGFELSSRKTTTASDTLGVTSTNTSAPSGLAAVGNRQAGRFVPQGGATPAAAAPQGGGTPAAPASSPAATKESIVDMIGNYKLNPTMLQRMSTKHPDILAMVGQKYPDFDQTTYNAKNKLISDYTSGTHSKEINAINTAMGHVAVLDQAVDALNNGDIRVLNAIGNKLGIEVGQQPAAAFKLIVHRVGPEISSAYIPGGGGEKERIADAKDFDENLSSGILHNNAAITVKLLRSKVGALENQYKNSVGRDDFGKRFITPEAQASFDRFQNAGGSTQKPAAPAGATHTAMGSDKKLHYTNDKGQDLGVAE